ncbi:MAG: 4a-hydroxytetrahydrobiopterin dehydratase [Dehalococcoidia bacterium]|nr:4a-hydroxytetrahydrobiopterin dehydratase [Dehalococcoidia bacterium]
MAARKCVPCRGDTPPLTEDEIGALLPQVPGWTVEAGQRLHRTYRFRDFAAGLALVNRIGAVAEEEDHHPDLVLAWGRVEVTLWTHIIDGLTENDFVVAAKTERLAKDATGRRPDKA